LAPIGEYKVKIKVGDRELAQPVTILKDPGAGGTEADVRAQGDLVKVLLDDVKQTVEAINRAENVRSQLATLQVRLGEKKDGKEPVHKDVKDAAEALDKKVVAVEETLLQMRVTGRGQDILRFPMKTAEQLLYEEAAKSRQALDDVLATDLVRFNALLAEKQLAGVVASFPTAPTP